jgi:predicted nucleic acid-binding protein
VKSEVLLDSCVVAKLVIPEGDSLFADQLVIESLEGNVSMLALDFALVEIANVIWKQHRWRTFSAAQAHERLLETFALPIQWISVEPDLTRSLEIAVQYEIAVYDAMFVAMAESLNCRAVTSDIKLLDRVQADFPQIERLH